MAHVAIDLDPELVAAQRGERARRARTIIGQAALLGVLADTTIRDGMWGLGWTTLVAGLVLTIVLVALSVGERITRERAAWLGVAMVFAAASTWRDADTLLVFNFVATMAALTFAAMSFAGTPAASVIGARVRDLVWAGKNATGDAIAGTPGLMRQADVADLVSARSRAAMPALRAAMLTIPLLFVFGSLFAGADPVFASMFSLPDVGVDTIASHVLVGGLCAWVCAGWLRNALARTTHAAPPERMPMTLGSVEISASLGGLVVLFAAFVGVQARWLFGGAAVVEATTGLTVAEYARRGFFELVTVAALLVPVILITRAAAADDATIKRHRALASTLLVLLGAVMISAFLRMALYVGNFGLTVDRLYASVFMAWLAIVVVAMGLTVLRGWEKPFAAIAVISGFATLAALNVSNPEAIVARSIVTRGDAVPGGMDYEYLSRLSGSAMPVAARAIADGKPSKSACRAARHVYHRGTVAAATVGGAWNWGDITGARAAERLITFDVQQRLCANVAWTSSDRP